MCITQSKHEMREIMSFERRGNFHVGFIYFYPFQYNTNVSAKRFYEGKWKIQDIVKLIVCSLLDEINLF